MMWIYMGYNFTSKLVLSQETVTKSHAVNPLAADSSFCVSSMQSLWMEKLAAIYLPLSWPQQLAKAEPLFGFDLEL